MAETKTGSLDPLDAEISIGQAARLLNVLRPYLVGMIKKGTLPARMVGKQRRLPLQTVTAYKAENRTARREVLRRLAELDQQLGL